MAAIETVARRINHGSAAPTAGTWQVGDLVINTAATGLSDLFWICTAAGTPGTWVASTVGASAVDDESAVIATRMFGG